VPPGNFTRAEYEKLVDGVKEYIRAGDIIQVVPSQRFTRPSRRRRSTSTGRSGP
jgi:anthranilate synthase component 1